MRERRTCQGLWSHQPRAHASSLNFPGRPCSEEKLDEHSLASAASTGGTGPRLADVSRLNTWYYSDAPASVRPQLDAARRISTFDEVTGGLGETTALFEARRCLSCGNCFECDNCYGVCPDNAIIKLGPGQRYQIDVDYCKGCGICAAECPCGAIDMVKERI